MSGERLLDVRAALRLRGLTFLEHVLVVMREPARRATSLEELGERHEEIELTRTERIAELFQALTKRIGIPSATPALRARRLFDACHCGCGCGCAGTSRCGCVRSDELR